MAKRQKRSLPKNTPIATRASNLSTFDSVSTRKLAAFCGLLNKRCNFHSTKLIYSGNQPSTR